jgi:PAS domain-containing protein
MSGASHVDAQHRLVVCNERYLQIYGLSQGRRKPGRPCARYWNTAGCEVRAAVSQPSTFARPASWHTVGGQGDRAGRWPRHRPDISHTWRRVGRTHEDVTELRKAERELIAARAEAENAPRGPSRTRPPARCAGRRARLRPVGRSRPLCPLEPPMPGALFPFRRSGETRRAF